MYKLINLRNYKTKANETLIRIDRQSPVGNPFYLNSEADRNKVCDQYEKYFHTQIKSNPEFISYINYIIRKIETEENVVLACWCTPKRCHGDTIINYIHKTLNEKEVTHK